MYNMSNDYIQSLVTFFCITLCVALLGFPDVMRTPNSRISDEPVVPPSLSSLHCPDSPFFSHTTLFSTWMPKYLPTHRCLCGRRTFQNPPCGSAWLGIRRLGWLSCNVDDYLFIRDDDAGHFQSKRRRQSENWRGMASVRGPGRWILSAYARIGRGWRIGVGAVIASTNHREWISNRQCLAWSILLSYMFPVSEQREPFPALVHGGRTGGIVGNFRRGG